MIHTFIDIYLSLFYGNAIILYDIYVAFLNLIRTIMLVFLLISIKCACFSCVQTHKTLLIYIYCDFILIL